MHEAVGGASELLKMTVVCNSSNPSRKKPEKSLNSPVLHPSYHPKSMLHPITGTAVCIVFGWSAMTGPWRVFAFSSAKPPTWTAYKKFSNCPLRWKHYKLCVWWAPPLQFVSRIHCRCWNLPVLYLSKEETPLCYFFDCHRGWENLEWVNSLFERRRPWVKIFLHQ